MFSALLSLLPSRFSRPNVSLIVLAVSALLLAFAERSYATANFTQTNSITVSSSPGVSVGNSITVSGLPGTITDITLTLTDLHVTNLDSVSIVLVPPSGTAFDLFGGACSSGNATLTLSDSGDTGTDAVSGMVPFLGAPAPARSRAPTCPSTTTLTAAASVAIPIRSSTTAGEALRRTIRRESATVIAKALALHAAGTTSAPLSTCPRMHLTLTAPGRSI